MFMIEQMLEKQTKSLRRRGAGEVKQWNPNTGVGFVSIGRLPSDPDFRFTADDVPEAWLEANDGMVPIGTKCDFTMVKHLDGKVASAEELKFNCTSFFQLGLTRDVVRGAALGLGLNPDENPGAADMVVPAPVQSEAIPRILGGEDLVIAAETGSGKSLAYMLPLVQLIQPDIEDRTFNYGIDNRSSSPLALVLCASRELAVQAYRTLKLISHKARCRVRMVHGGSENWTRQKREITQMLDVLVATPDRLLKFFKKKDIKFHDIKHIVIDEADFLLTQGFEDVYEILENIAVKTRHNDVLRYTLVTASMTQPMWRLLEDDPRWKNMSVLESKRLHKPQANCTHSMIRTKGRNKLDMLISLMRPEITGKSPSKQTFIFCNTVTACKSIAYNMRQAFKGSRDCDQYIGALHKQLTTQERDQTLRKFALGEYRCIVCTDLAQRGIDMPTCGHVINFDFPLNSIDYLHRAGRTARYGEEGKVTSLVCKGDQFLALAIEKSVQLGKPINDLSADKRDYMRGGSLHHLIAKHKQATGEERGIPKAAPYSGGLR